MSKTILSSRFLSKVLSFQLRTSEVSALKDWPSLGVQPSFWLGTHKKCLFRHWGPLLNFLNCFLKCVPKQDFFFFYFISPLLCHSIAPACCTQASDTTERRIWATQKAFAQNFLYPTMLLYNLVPKISMGFFISQIFYNN